AFVVDAERTATAADRAVVDHRDAGGGDALAHLAGEHRRAFPVEVALEAVADRLVQKHSGPPGAQHDVHLPGGTVDRLQIDQRLAQRLVDLAPPAVRCDPGLEAGPSAGAGGGAFASAVL